MEPTRIQNENIMNTQRNQNEYMLIQANTTEYIMNSEWKQNENVMNLWWVHNVYKMIPLRKYIG